jgi:hypothetical protein
MVIWVEGLETKRIVVDWLEKFVRYTVLFDLENTVQERVSVQVSTNNRLTFSPVLELACSRGGV